MCTRAFAKIGLVVPGGKQGGLTLVFIPSVTIHSAASRQTVNGNVSVMLVLQMSAVCSWDRLAGKLWDDRDIR